MMYGSPLGLSMGKFESKTVLEVIQGFWKEWEGQEGCEHKVVYHQGVGQYCIHCGADAFQIHKSGHGHGCPYHS